MLFIFLAWCRGGLAQNVDSLLNDHRTVFGHIDRDRREGITFRLTGVYTRDEVIYYSIEAWNHSPLVYDVDGIRCSIRDRKMMKRHAFQEITMAPLWIKGDSLRLGAGKRAVWIIALRKEVLPPDQYLSIQLLEQWGSRNLEVRVGSRILMKAKLL